jgi:hypothetical protein
MLALMPGGAGWIVDCAAAEPAQLPVPSMHKSTKIPPVGRLTDLHFTVRRFQLITWLLSSGIECISPFNQR